MYAYDRFDQSMVEERAQQFRAQVLRRIDGRLTEDEFKPLRLQNGLYMQLHAYMLRIAVPYGLVSSAQLRALADVARKYDRGYAHLTTRQNVQLNWPKLEDIPTILDELASVQMHAIQTSGNCIRNITCDPYAGVAPDELEDPRPYCELLRQWSTFHPEFAFLPRKFKLAVTGAREDRAATSVHDIGLRLVERDGEVGFAFFVGGGQGRTPLIAPCIAPFIPKRDLVSYTEAVLRVYNRLGRRDNKYKARIKILVKQTGAEAFAQMVAEEHAQIVDGPLRLSDEDIERAKRHFRPPPYEVVEGGAGLSAAHLDKDRAYARWVEHNVVAHRMPGYAIVNLSVKSPDLPPGDLTSDQLDAVAELADQYAFGRAVITHRQNLVFTDVRQRDLRTLHRELARAGFATPNVGKLTDVVCCPGLDYCALANARSISVARDLTRRFQDLGRLYDLGDLQLNISGCINACGHHHVGHIGVLGIDKQGEEFYQLMLGGSSGDTSSLGKVLGRALTHDEVGEAVDRVVVAYLAIRQDDETFLECYRRVGPAPFKEAVYLPADGQPVRPARPRASAVRAPKPAASPASTGASSPGAPARAALLRRDDAGVHVVEADAWREVSEAESVRTDLLQGDALLSLERLEALAPSAPPASARLGVRVAGDIDPARLEPFLSSLALVVVDFPKFTDGRGYSVGRLLRERYGYEGELRASGHVLRDQLFFMARCGFDTFELHEGKRVDDALAAFEDFSTTYQPAADHEEPIWRRRGASEPPAPRN